MASHESRIIRERLQREVRRPGMTVERERSAWDAYAAIIPLPADAVTRGDIVGDVPCLWVTNAKSLAPGVILYAHGGGLVTGSPTTHREFASRLAAGTGHAVLLADYRLLPENPFPAPLHDILAVYRALLENTHLAPGEIIFGGDSSGAALMVAAMNHLRDGGEAMPACAFSISGTFDATLSGDSMESRRDLDPLLSRDTLEDWRARLDAAIDLRSPEISPLHADLADLPPILLQVGDHELWLSDSIRVAEKIRAAGGAVDLSVWEDMWHVFPMVADLPEASAAIAEIAGFIARHLGNGTRP